MHCTGRSDISTEFANGKERLTLTGPEGSEGAKKERKNKNERKKKRVNDLGEGPGRNREPASEGESGDEAGEIRGEKEKRKALLIFFTSGAGSVYDAVHGGNGRKRERKETGRKT